MILRAWLAGVLFWWACGLATPSPLHAEPRRTVTANRVMETLALRYHEWHQRYFPPDVLPSELQALYFDFYWSSVEWNDLVFKLEFEDWKKIARRLNRNFGYRLPVPPFSRGALAEMTMTKKMEWSSRLRLAAIAQRIATLRREIAVPETPVAIPRNLAAALCGFKVRPGFVQLNARFANLDTLGVLFAFVGSTPSGRSLLEKVCPKIKDGEIEFALLSEHTRRRWPQLRKENGVRAFHAFTFPDSETTHSEIYIDPGVELGLAIELLFHELSHAVDNELNRAQRRISLEIIPQWRSVRESVARRLRRPAASLRDDELSAAERAQVSEMSYLYYYVYHSARADSERAVYRDSGTFIDELKAVSPELADYFSATAQRGLSYPGPISDAGLCERYGIPNYFAIPPRSVDCEQELIFAPSELPPNPAAYASPRSISF